MNAKAIRRSLKNLSSLDKPQKLLNRSEGDVIQEESPKKPVCIKRDSPGPGHYNVQTYALKPQNKDEKFQFFGSTEDRFPTSQRSMDESNISPGMYTEEMNKVKNPFSIIKLENKKVPFGTNEKRFITLKTTNADFSPGNFVTKPWIKIKKNINSKGVFGSTEKRFPQKDFKNKDLLDLGPGTYNI
mmetsp:Transcript_1216/g.1101  ORF Transcript_1216/g.1101 Transcript_1216/m.1101 type:complete len:186 (-) Transcript_1216:80-637(-)